MIPVVDVVLHEIGPNRLEVLRAVDSLLRCGFLAISRSLEVEPLLIATGESLEVQHLVRGLTEMGAKVTQEPHEIPNWNSETC